MLAVGSAGTFAASTLMLRSFTVRMAFVVVVDHYRLPRPQMVSRGESDRWSFEGLKVDVGVNSYAALR